MNDEPAIPKNGPYEHDHTRAWASKIDAAPGFVFVTPQYNGGYPAALKNAIDHLYTEWTGKPALIVTYGGHGGAHCGEQLDVVCRFVKLRPIDPRPALTLPHEVIANNTGEIDSDIVFAAQVSDVQKALAELERALSMPAAQLS